MATAAAYRRTPVVADWRRRYEVVGTLGSGGFATVYRAYDRHLERDVALKVIGERGGLSGRVTREVEAAAALAHPGIVRVFDVFTDGDHSFIVYELVEGRQLDGLIGTLDDAGAVEVVVQILEALSHAHAQGVVHRDVKPHNVMLTGEGQVKVMDFGIARLAGADTLTAEGDMVGTIAYMSPEQAAGRRVGPASDVYSAAVVLYELLSGENPAPGSTPGERLGNIAAGRLLPLADLRPDLPSSLLDIVAQALAPVAAQRPPADLMAQELRLVLAGGDLRRHRALPAHEMVRAGSLAERIVGAGLAAVATWTVLDLLPAYPGSWLLPLTLIALTVWAVTPSGGLAFLLAALVFPLFNVSVYVGAVYLAAAVVTLLLARRRPLTALWPVLALVLIPVYGTFLAPAAAAVLGRRRGPLTAAWAGLGTAFFLTLTGVGGSPFTFFRPAGDAAAAIAGADGFAGAFAGIGTLLFAPQGLLQAAVWAALAAALPYVVGAHRLERRMWGWSLTFAALFAACALLPALLDRPVTGSELLLNLVVAAVVILSVTLPGLRGAAAHGSGARPADEAGDDRGVQET
jgi:eukaryotic-like serine/threonine-protein kinase